MVSLGARASEPERAKATLGALTTFAAQGASPARDPAPPTSQDVPDVPDYPAQGVQALTRMAP